jgi:hypothetical protein
MASRSQIKAVVHAAMVAAGFRARGVVDNLNMPHKHNDALIDGLYNAIASFHFRDFFDPTPALPTNPAAGDVFISSDTARGWTEGNIYEWSGTAWNEAVPVEGMWVWIDALDEFYKYDGSSWSMFTATVGSHHHEYIVSPGTVNPALYIDSDGGFVFVAADGTLFKHLISNLGVSYYRWSGSEWVDLNTTLQF